MRGASPPGSLTIDGPSRGADGERSSAPTFIYLIDCGGHASGPSRPGPVRAAAPSCDTISTHHAEKVAPPRRAGAGPGPPGLVVSMVVAAPTGPGRRGVVEDSRAGQSSATRSLDRRSDC